MNEILKRKNKDLDKVLNNIIFDYIETIDFKYYLIDYLKNSIKQQRICTYFSDIITDKVFEHLLNNYEVFSICFQYFNIFVGVYEVVFESDTLTFYVKIESETEPTYIYTGTTKKFTINLTK